MTIKTTLSLTIALFFFANLFAQTPIQRNDLIPSIGESFMLNFADYADPGPSGMDQVWDLSALVGSQMFTFDYISVGSTPYASSFPNSDYCVQTSVPDDDTYTFSYFGTDGQDDYFDGIAYTGATVYHNDPLKYYQFPITYGDSFEDYFESTFVSGVTWFRSGYTNYTVDGYGSLILPFGTIDDVYRIKTVQDYSDVTTGFTLDNHVEYYHYVKAGTHHYLASVQSAEVIQTGQSTLYTYLLDESSVGMIEQTTLDNNIIIVPNPVNDVASIIVENDNNELLDIELMDLTGSRIANIGTIEANYTNSIEYDFSELSPGLYLVKISTEKGYVTKKVTVN